MEKVLLIFGLVSSNITMTAIALAESIVPIDSLIAQPVADLNAPSGIQKSTIVALTDTEMDQITAGHLTPWWRSHDHHGEHYGWYWSSNGTLKGTPMQGMHCHISCP